MNSGLYAFAGDSATATAAAWANRLDEPMTNVSKVYFGFSRLPPSPAGRTRSSRWCRPMWPARDDPSLIGRPGTALRRTIIAGRDWRSRHRDHGHHRGGRVQGTGLRHLVGRPDRYRDLDGSAEMPGQRLGDGRAQLRLDDVAGERVRHAQQRGVVDDRAQRGQAEIRPALRRHDLVVEQVGRGAPHRGVVHRFCHPAHPCSLATHLAQPRESGRVVISPMYRRQLCRGRATHCPQVVHTGIRTMQSLSDRWSNRSVHRLLLSLAVAVLGLLLYPSRMNACFVRLCSVLG